MITVYKTKVMLSHKRGSLIRDLVTSIESDRETLNFYRRSGLLGCEMYYVVKYRYIARKDKLAEIVASMS